MTILQGPVPPVPPTPPSAQFDPNLIFLSDGGPPIVLLIVIAALTALVIIMWPIMRAFGRRLEGKAGGDPALRSDVEQLHTRLGEVDALQARLAELEERVDFTERLLAQAQQPARLGASTEESGR
jgi:Tfp pilus assembly protein PilO